MGVSVATVRRMEGGSLTDDEVERLGQTFMLLEQRMGELKGHENEKVVVHCRSGQRSLQFAQLLRQQGFKDAKSMAGGILLWNKDINPGGPQY